MQTITLTDTQKLADEEIIALVLGGQTYLFETVMRRYNQRLYRIARGMNITEADSDDIIQQSFIKAYENLESFKGESKFSTWLTRILINQCLMQKRRKNIIIHSDFSENTEAMEHQLNHANAPVSPEKVMVQEELKKILEEAIEYLPEDFKTVYIMREVEDMSVKETSACLNISESNVKVRLHRAKILLKHYIEKYMSPADIFGFGNKRCDCIVKNVMEYISGLSA